MKKRILAIKGKITELEPLSQQAEVKLLFYLISMRIENMGRYKASAVPSGDPPIVTDSL